MPRINHNIQALVSSGALKRTERSLSGTLEKLSTGLAINRSSDNAAGLSVSEQLRSQIHGLGMGNRNIQDGISLLNIAEGALMEMENMLQRLRELSIQASTATYGREQREFMQMEMVQLTDELDRVARSTQFNGMPLLSGESGRPGQRNPWGSYVPGDNESGAFIHIGPNTSRNDLLQIRMPAATTMALGLRGELRIYDEDEGSPTFGDLIRIDPEGLLLDFTTAEGAQRGIGLLDSAINAMNRIRADVGAYTNRLEHALTNQMNALINITSAESLIRDADFAKESMNFTRLQVLQQSSTAMLVQANALPNNILGLLNI